MYFNRNKLGLVRRFLTIVLLLMMPLLSAWGAKARGGLVPVIQPDGTRLLIRIHGDERFSYKTNAEGYLVAQDENGWYRFADYNSGVLRPGRELALSYSSGTALPAPEQVMTGGRIFEVRSPELLSAPIIGTKSSVDHRTLVIPVAFSDQDFATPMVRNRIYNLFNQLNYTYEGAVGSVREYFRDNLGASFNMTFEICEPVTVQGTAAYYGSNTGGVTDANLKRLVINACTLAKDAGVDFSRFDGDADGVVDNVFIIFAGHNEAEGGGDDAIWPQAWNISEAQLFFDGVKISNFCCYSEFSGSTGFDFARIGTICHEICHVLGLVDMYDVNGETEGEGCGLCGSLSIMDRGNYNGDGHIPPYLNVVERLMLGLADQKTISAPQDLVIDPVYEATSVYRFRTSFADENFYLEYRDGTHWDNALGQQGLVIYHVDRTDNPAGSMSARRRWTLNSVNACADHQCCVAVSAMGTSPIAVDDLFFPGRGGVRTIHSAVNFPLMDWNGRGTGFGLTNINPSAVGLTCEVVEDNSWNLPVINSYTVETDQRSALLKWEPSKSLGGRWQVVWGSVNSVVTDTVLTNATSLRFAPLEPGETYSCILTYLYMGVSGKPFHLEFQTPGMLSSFPLIADMDRIVTAGTLIRLHLLNITEDIAEVQWYVDGQLNESGYFSPGAGQHRIKAYIRYPDGSTEILSKRLTVKEANDE